MKAAHSTYRPSTWALFAVVLLAGLALEHYGREMHLSKMICFASIGVWARDMTRPQRWWLLGLVGLSWLMILLPWYQYRNQHLVPIGNGAYRIENN